MCTSLLEHGEVQDEGDLGGIVRTQVLRQLCAMNPSAALVVHSKALKLCRMPGLAVALILDFGVDGNGKSRQLVFCNWDQIRARAESLCLERQRGLESCFACPSRGKEAHSTFYLLSYNPVGQRSSLTDVVYYFFATCRFLELK